MTDEKKQKCNYKLFEEYRKKIDTILLHSTKDYVYQKALAYSWLSAEMFLNIELISVVNQLNEYVNQRLNDNYGRIN